MAVGLAIATANHGMVSMAIELAAMLKEVKGAAKKYPTNAIIQATFGKDGSYEEAGHFLESNRPNPKCWVMN